MIFLPSSAAKTERPVVFDRTRVNQELVASYPRDLMTSGIGGAVLVYVDIDEFGRVSRARSQQPRLLGFIPRPKPAVYSPTSGEVLRGLVWTDNSALLQTAEDAALRTRFIPGSGGGIVVAWPRYPLVCYFAADPGYGQPMFNLTTGILNT